MNKSLNWCLVFYDSRCTIDNNWLFQAIVEEVCMSHYAANFLIYAATGLNFRSELRALVRRSCPCVVTCFRRFCCCVAGTGNKDADAAVLEMREANETTLRNENGYLLASERRDTWSETIRWRHDYVTERTVLIGRTIHTTERGCCKYFAITSSP